jgi:hypothetical protein
LVALQKNDQLAVAEPPPAMRVLPDIDPFEVTTMSIHRFVPTAAAVLLLAATGFADARPDTRAMSCQQLQQTIQSHHAVVLTTGPNTYDRYVRQFGNECDWPEVPTAAYVPTRDGHCPVYRCEQAVGGLLPD